MKLIQKHDLDKLIADHNIQSVSMDSRNIQQNSIFVAIKGQKFDANQFIDLAFEKGAAVVLTDDKNTAEKYKERKVFLVENARKTLSEIAYLIHNNIPGNMLAITGTNGKSSVVHYLGQLLSLLGQKVASIGTLGIKVYEEGADKETIDTGFTTNDAVTYYKTLTDLKKKGVDYCAIEASSIGIDQYRLYDTKFKVAGFTSFTQDHLDYHKTMDEYLKAKLRLFSEHQDNESIAVINSDMEDFPKIRDFLNSIERKYVAVGSNGDCSYSIGDYGLDGQAFSVKYQNQEYKLSTKIIGAFQILNILLSCIMLEKLGFKFDEIISLVKYLTAPNGRLERVSEEGLGSRVFVDYAHTPDALRNALKELKSVTVKENSKLIVVFGCGGDRDPIKRPLMGAIAYKIADIVIVTDDNPRSEVPSEIRKEIMRACPSATEIEERQNAIEFAIRQMGEKDIVLIAGKGHEDYQIIGDEIIHFSDKEVASSFIFK